MKCDHPDKFDRYVNKNQSEGICKQCGKKWKLYLNKYGVTVLQYYNNISELEID